MAVGNHRALALATKGMAYSDPLTKGVLVTMTRIYLEDGEIIIIKKGGGSESGPGQGLPDHLKLQPFTDKDNQLKTSDEYLEQIKKALRDKDKKIIGIEVDLVRKSINPNIKLSANLLEKTLKASLIEEEIVAKNDPLKISVKLI